MTKTHKWILAGALVVGAFLLQPGVRHAIADTAYNSGFIGTIANPLPVVMSADAGWATAARQPGIGTAGTPSTDVLSMQGIDGGYPLNVAGTVGVTQPVSVTILDAGSPAWVTGSVAATQAPGTYNWTRYDLDGGPAPLPTGASTETTLAKLLPCTSHITVLAPDAGTSGIWYTDGGSLGTAVCRAITASTGGLMNVGSAVAGPCNLLLDVEPGAWNPTQVGSICPASTTAAGFGCCLQ